MAGMKLREMVKELPLLAMMEAHLMPQGTYLRTGGIVADVDITINAPVTWSDDTGVLTIADGVTVTTDDVFTVGKTILALGGGKVKTLTGSGTLSISEGGGISYTGRG